MAQVINLFDGGGDYLPNNPKPKSKVTVATTGNPLLDALNARIAATQEAISASETALANEAQAVAKANIEEQKVAAANAYYEAPVGSTGKTQAQLDAEADAKRTAQLTGGIVTDTGKVVPNPLNTTGMTGQQVDSVAAIKALLSSYGIGDLGDAITNAVVKGYSSDTIKLIMQDPNSNDPLAVAFQQRFPANKARMAAGKAVLSPAEYLAAEKTYAQVMQSYGVSNLATRATMNSLIENDVSAAEVADRVGLAVNRIKNADAATKQALAQYYPMLNQDDIVSAVLNPSDALPALQRKVQVAEIGGAALAQGLKTSDNKINIAMGAQALADLGITKSQAQAGFAQVAEVLPRAEFLSQISQGADYGQLQAEQEAFQGLASAKRARQSLVSQEQARFAGQAGVNRASLTSRTRGTI